MNAGVQNHCKAEKSPPHTNIQSTAVLSIIRNSPLMKGWKMVIPCCWGIVNKVVGERIQYHPSEKHPDREHEHGRSNRVTKSRHKESQKVTISLRSECVLVSVREATPTTNTTKTAVTFLN